MCVTDCKYDVVREAAVARDWKLVDEDVESGSRKCHVYWVDVPTVMERTHQLHPWQRINHFPGMSNVARKSRLAQNLDRMRRTFPLEFSFYPRTWVLPAEWGGFKAEFDSHGKSTRTFIIKPDSGCQGKGIFLTQNLDRVDPIDSQVAQIYIRKPLLIDSLKFDLRVYVLVTSVIPLRVYVFKDGLARFCTEKYLHPSADNLDERCRHLTNYAINKDSTNFIANDSADRDDRGSKRSLRWLLDWITTEHGEGMAAAVWQKVCSACIKTLVSILPTLCREYLHTFGPDKHMQGSGTEGYLGERSTMTDEHCADAQLADDIPSATLGHGSPGAEQSARQMHGDTSSFCRSTLNSRREKPIEPTTEQENKQGNGRSYTAAMGSNVKEGESPSTSCQWRGEQSRSRHGTNNVVEGSRCVEILGFDFMIDASLKPWLIEVNHLPSFATDSPLDRSIKSQVVRTAMSVLRAKADDRKRYEGASKRDAQLRLYKLDNWTGITLREQERREAEAAVAVIRRKAIAYGEPRTSAACIVS